MSECMTQEDAERMDNEQAVAILKPLRDMMRDQYGCPISDAYFALDKAITTLSQPQRMKGRWVRISPAGIYECSICGKNVMTSDIDAYDYCHGCGADMRGDKDAAD